MTPAQREALVVEALLQLSDAIVGLTRYTPDGVLFFEADALNAAQAHARSILADALTQPLAKAGPLVLRSVGWRGKSVVITSNREEAVAAVGDFFDHGFNTIEIEPLAEEKPMKFDRRKSDNLMVAANRGIGFLTSHGGPAGQKLKDVANTFDEVLRNYALLEGAASQPVSEAVEGAWRPIADAPRDGTGFLAYGVHGDPVSENAAHGVQPGDHWWGIILWDIWRGLGWRFSKDGTAMWGAPTHWQPLPSPPGDPE